jgi:flagellar basal-body rod protein FlgC
MNLLGMMELSGSALQAERVRAEVVAANMANAETTRTATGGPYRRQHVVFAADSNPNAQNFRSQFSQMAGGSSSAAESGLEGVRVAGVVEDKAPPLERYDPGHPDADANGYVAYPDINPLTEMVDLMGATRAYGLNSSAVESEKSMVQSSLEILK